METIKAKEEIGGDKKWCYWMPMFRLNRWYNTSNLAKCQSIPKTLEKDDK